MASYTRDNGTRTQRRRLNPTTHRDGTLDVVWPRFALRSAQERAPLGWYPLDHYTAKSKLRHDLTPAGKTDWAKAQFRIQPHQLSQFYPLKTLQLDSWAGVFRVYTFMFGSASPKSIRDAIRSDKRFAVNTVWNIRHVGFADNHNGIRCTELLVKKPAVEYLMAYATGKGGSLFCAEPEDFLSPTRAAVTHAEQERAVFMHLNQIMAEAEHARTTGKNERAFYFANWASQIINPRKKIFDLADLAVDAAAIADDAFSELEKMGIDGMGGKKTPAERENIPEDAPPQQQTAQQTAPAVKDQLTPFEIAEAEREKNNALQQTRPVASTSGNRHDSSTGPLGG